MRRKKPKSKEAPVQKAIKQYLELRGCRVLRTNAGKSFIRNPAGEITRAVQMAPTGTADLNGCLPWGQFFALEIKAPGNEPTEAQWDYLREIAAIGGHAGWADSIEAAEKFFDKGKAKWELR